MLKLPAIYIMTNKRNGTLYVGVTSNLPKRVWEHKKGVVEGFSSKYKTFSLLRAGRHDVFCDYPREADQSWLTCKEACFD